MTLESKRIVIAFDLYGTLLSTESIKVALSKHLNSEIAAKVAALWRRLQLEYTWRLNSMKQYQSFSNITRNSLNHAIAELELHMKDSEKDEVMKAYDSLTTFPDVPPALKQLEERSWIKPVIFSNGTSEMIRNSVDSSDLKPFAKTFQNTISIEKVRCFKPDPVVYYHLAEEVGKNKEEMGDIWLVSSNPFDVQGAKAVGMKTAWVDRTHHGWSDQLITTMPCDIIEKNLKEMVDRLFTVLAEPS